MHANEPEMAKKWEKKKKNEAERDYKDEYKKFQSSTKAKKYRAELNKYNRKKGTYGNGDGKDASHKGGKIVGFESQSKNRGRAEKSRLKKESPDFNPMIDKILDEVIDEYQLNEGPNQMTQIYKDLDKTFKQYDHTRIQHFGKVSKYLKDKFSKGSSLPDTIASFYNDYRGGEDMKKNIAKLTKYAKKMKGYAKESVNEGYRKAKDKGGVRIAQAIHNNVDGIYELVIKDGKDPKEVMRAFEGPLKNSIKAGIKHKYKPHPKADGADVKIKTFQSELKKFQKIADVVASKPSKAAIKRMKDAYRTIWNHKFGAEIALGGKLYPTIIESINERRQYQSGWQEMNFIVQQLVKYGNTKSDAIKMTQKHYNHVIKRYRNSHLIHPIKKAEIISSLSANESVNEALRPSDKKVLMVIGRDIINLIKKKNPNLKPSKQLGQALNSIFRAMNFSKDNANYQQYKKYFPKNYNEKLLRRLAKTYMSEPFNVQNTFMRKVMDYALKESVDEGRPKYGKLKLTKDKPKKITQRIWSAPKRIMSKRAWLRMPDMNKMRKNGVDYVATSIGPKKTQVYIPVIFESVNEAINHPKVQKQAKELSKVLKAVVAAAKKDDRKLARKLVGSIYDIYNDLDWTIQRDLRYKESVNERTDSQAKKNLMRALKNSKVANVFSYDNDQIAIEMTNGDDYIVGNIQSYNPNESINEANIKDIEKVLKTRSAKKIDGMYMDMTTANAIMTVWKALNTSNRKKFEKLPLKKMVDVTWKLVK